MIQKSRLGDDTKIQVWLGKEKAMQLYSLHTFALGESTAGERRALMQNFEKGWVT